MNEKDDLIKYDIAANEASISVSVGIGYWIQLVVLKLISLLFFGSLLIIENKTSKPIGIRITCKLSFLRASLYGFRGWNYSADNRWSDNSKRYWVIQPAEKKILIVSWLLNLIDLNNGNLIFFVNGPLRNHRVTIKEVIANENGDIDIDPSVSASDPGPLGMQWRLIGIESKYIAQFRKNGEHTSDYILKDTIQEIFYRFLPKLGKPQHEDLKDAFDKFKETGKHNDEAYPLFSMPDDNLTLYSNVDLDMSNEFKEAEAQQVDGNSDASSALSEKLNYEKTCNYGWFTDLKIENIGQYLSDLILDLINELLLLITLVSQAIQNANIISVNLTLALYFITLFNAYNTINEPLDRHTWKDPNDVRNMPTHYLFLVAPGTISAISNLVVNGSNADGSEETSDEIEQYFGFYFGQIYIILFIFLVWCKVAYQRNKPKYNKDGDNNIRCENCVGVLIIAFWTIVFLGIYYLVLCTVYSRWIGVKDVIWDKDVGLYAGMTVVLIANVACYFWFMINAHVIGHCLTNVTYFRSLFVTSVGIKLTVTGLQDLIKEIFGFKCSNVKTGFLKILAHMDESVAIEHWILLLALLSVILHLVFVYAFDFEY